MSKLLTITIIIMGTLLLLNIIGYNPPATGFVYKLVSNGTQTDTGKIVDYNQTDSRLSNRESLAVNDFENSTMMFHIMRDHPHHNAFVLGGMFGLKKGLIDDMKNLCGSFQKTNQYGTDYYFFDSIKNKIPAFLIMSHDEFRGGLNFPTKRENWEFVGEVYDENNNYAKGHRDALINHFK